MQKQYDVLIAGAGASGICAAVSAAREGLSVLLVEKSGMLGGTNTQSMVCPLMGFHAGPYQVVKGIAQEIVDRLQKRGGTLGHIQDPLGVTQTITPIEPEILKQVYFELLRETPGIDLMLHTFITGVQRDGDRMQSAQAVHKGGTLTLTAKSFIDATGDGDLAAFAGLPYIQGRAADGFSQPMTLVMKVGNVDLKKVRSTMQAHPEQFVLCKDADQIPYIAVSGYFDAVAKAHEHGELTLPRDRVLFFQGVRPHEVIVNMSRVVKHKSTDAYDLTQAEMESREQIDEILAFLKKNIDGFKNAYLIETGATIGVRESRHIQGAYTLTEQDILSQTEFPDAVAMCGFPIDIHDPLGKELHWTKTDTASCYDVPFRVMYHASVANLLFTGRCVSATHEAAASVRISPTAMALGEAAGIAASIAKGRPFSEIDIPTLRERIDAKGGIPGRAYLTA